MADERRKRAGSLTVVGTGIKFLSHTTTETPACIEQADRVLYGVPDAATGEWIDRLNPRAESFCDYLPDQPRKATYEKWIERIVECVEAGEKVCAVFYGHPGVFTYTSHEAIRRVRERGYEARMLPGISAEDTLIADLGIDPGVHGLQSYEATDFLIRPRAIDTSTGLLLWQCGVVGQLGYQEPEHAREGVRVLAEKLEKLYGPDHEVILYEGAMLSVFDANVRRIPLSTLSESEIGMVTTLYVPPKARAKLDLDMVDRLRIPRSKLDALDVGRTSPDPEGADEG